MKKVILGFIIVAVLVIAFGVYYILTNLDAKVEAAIEEHGGEATQTAVPVRNVRIKLSDGSGKINGLAVANPKGFTLPNAASFKEIGLDIDLESLTEEPYVLEEATVRSPQIFIEINKDNKNNLNELVKLLSRGASTTPAATSDKAADEGPRIIIRRLVFADGSISAKIAPLSDKEYTLKLPSLTVKNLGGANGAPATEIAREIVDRFINHAKDELKNSQYGAEIERFRLEFEAKLNQGKAMLSDEEAKAKAKVAAEEASAKAKLAAEEAKVKQEANDQLDKEKQKVEDKLKGLLGQ